MSLLDPQFDWTIARIVKVCHINIAVCVIGLIKLTPVIYACRIIWKSVCRAAEIY